VKQAVFIERDGVLNEARVEKQQQVSPLTLEDFKPYDSAAALLKKLKSTGLVIVVTSNQPGISRGYQSRRELDRMHERLKLVGGTLSIESQPHRGTTIHARVPVSPGTDSISAVGKVNESVVI